MRVLILSCGTGGGHNSAALAIQENLLERKIEAHFVEYLDIINPKIKDRVNHLYIKTTEGNGKVFKVVYHLGELYQKTKLKSPVYQLNWLNKKKLYNYIKDNGYDYIVTTHLFAAQALTAIKKDKPIRFMEVATDYVSIPFWEETNPDYFVIPSKELEKDFQDKRIGNVKILPLGIPVKRAFRQQYNKEECKQELNLEVGKNYVLILTGSMGFGNITQMVKELLENIKEVIFIVACGNNKELLDNLKNTYLDNDRVNAIPFTDKISEYMKSSEVILTKPGGLTTTEIANLRKPLIHTMPIPGCENYNAEFFSKRKMSVKCNTIQEVVETTKELLKNKELQQKMCEKQREYISRNTADDISEIILREINERK